MGGEGQAPGSLITTVRWYPAEPAVDPGSDARRDRTSGGGLHPAVWRWKAGALGDQAVTALGRVGMRTWAATRVASARMVAWSQRMGVSLPERWRAMAREPLDDAAGTARPAAPRPQRRARRPQPAGVAPRNAAVDASAVGQVNEAQRQRDERHLQRTRAAAALRRLMAQRLGLHVEPDGAQVEIEGVSFAAVRDAESGGYMLVVVGTCPGCGLPVRSDDIGDLEDVGWALEQMEAGRTWCEECRGAASPPVDGPQAPSPGPLGGGTGPRGE
ncbi:MAG: hypothetical protein QJR03_07405 [Sphaerobacter sp.]|nr:hypothetical protein [Sphaerobacter sp.]